MSIKHIISGLIQYLSVIPFLAIAGLAAGLSLAPGIYLFERGAAFAGGYSGALHYILIGLSLVLAYVVYGLVLVLVAPLLNFILRARLKPWRGPAVSLGALPWYVHACLTLIVRLSFLEFVTPTPINILFYRLMGMKIGHSVTINSTAIADPSLIELEDKVTIGGSASIMAHYAQGGYLVVAPVKICKGATIGLRAIIMGGVEVGEKAKVLAGSFVLPNTKIPAGESWGGIPAAPIDIKKFRESIEC